MIIAIHTVPRKVQYDLLQVDRVGAYQQWLLGAYRAQGNVSLLRLGRKNLHCICDRFIEIQLVGFNLAPALHEFLHVRDDLGRMLIGLPNVAENLLRATDIRRFRTEQLLRDLGVEHNR